MRRARRAAVIAAAATLLPLAATHATPGPDLPDLSCLSASGVPVLVGGDARVVAAAGGTVTGRIAPLGVVQVRFATPAAAARGVALLRATPGVRWAEPEVTFHADAAPSDPLLRRQWGLAKIGAPRAWDREVGTSNPVTVAILDTGIAFGHPDLQGRTAAGLDVVNNDTDPVDDQFHGTHVAGIVGAATDNRVGVAGVSWGAKLLAEKVLNSKGSGGTCGIAAAMVHAVTNGAKVLNLSLGSTTAACPAVITEAVAYATKRGALVLASSGNKAQSGNPVQYPAGCDGVVAVGATDVHDKAAKFSTHHPYVALSAPGVDVLSTYRGSNGSSEYAILSGTSMATPYAAGLAALLFAAHPDWTPAQVTARMEGTASDLGPRGRDEWFGYGRIDARRALAAQETRAAPGQAPYARAANDRA
jgi:subtilisin family serine protease